MVASFAHAQTAKTVISNIEDSTSGWGSCTDCAGGKNHADIYWMAQFQTRARQRWGQHAILCVGEQAKLARVVLDKLGAHNSASKFTWDFWIYLDEASLSAQA